MVQTVKQMGERRCRKKSKRNEWMVDQSDVVVAYVTHNWGGAAAMLRYAERKRKHIINIASDGCPQQDRTER